jgi:hypothetical protein
MAQRGRKSTASNIVRLGVTGARPPLKPLALLTHSEKLLFSQCAQLNPHLVEGDVQMLTAYAQALAKTYALAKKNDSASVSSWEKASRVALSFATKLRITQQSTTNPDSAWRRRRDANIYNDDAPKPWEQDDE